MELSQQFKQCRYIKYNHTNIFAHCSPIKFPDKPKIVVRVVGRISHPKKMNLRQHKNGFVTSIKVKVPHTESRARETLRLEKRI